MAGPFTVAQSVAVVLAACEDLVRRRGALRLALAEVAAMHPFCGPTGMSRGGAGGIPIAVK